MSLEVSTQRRNQEGGCWDCVSCVLTYDLGARLWGNDGMYCKSGGNVCTFVQDTKGERPSAVTAVSLPASQGRGWRPEPASPPLSADLPPRAGSLSERVRSGALSLTFG